MYNLIYFYNKNFILFTQVINRETNVSREEAAYHLYATLINLIYAKLAKDECFEELKQRIPSLLYLFYVEEIFTEKFINETLIKRTQSFKNTFHLIDNENLFLGKAVQFIEWYQKAPYEDE